MAIEHTIICNKNFFKIMLTKETIRSKIHLARRGTDKLIYNTGLNLVRQLSFARVAQWWSIALPRRGSRVRIPSRAFFILKFLGATGVSL